MHSGRLWGSGAIAMPMVMTAWHGQAESGMSTPLIPQTWLRDPLFVLQTRRGKGGMTVEEQQASRKNHAIHQLSILRGPPRECKA